MDAHCGREIQSVGDLANTFENCEGSDEAWSKLGGWTTGLVVRCDVIGRKEDSITNVKGVLSA